VSNATAVRVLVVDGDAVLRQGLSRLLGAQPGIEVVGWAISGRTAAPKLASYRPDLVLLDVGSQPGEAIELLQNLQQAGSPMQRVVLATADVPGEVLARAASLGAAEVVRRPSGSPSEAQLAQMVREIVPTVLRAGGSSVPAPASRPAPVLPAPAAAPVSSVPMWRTPGGRQPQVVAIGVSTGGPKALSSLLPRLPADFPLPILIVQHMPPKFTASLAESLDKACKLRVREAADGDRPQRGTILIAPGGKHLRIVRSDKGEVCDLTEDAPVCSCRPSVDYLFGSLQQVYGGRVLTVVLTGMGEDGWLGSRRLYDAGACVLAQDEASSTVFGMPRGPIQAGIAAAVSLDNMAEAIVNAARGASCN
jgi:two-component system chemotaxis response regulator CheB